MKQKTIIVTGIPGVGKTTVLNELSKLVEPEKKKLQVFNYGFIMLEVAKLEGLKIERDMLRQVPLNIQQRLQANAAIEIVNRSSNVGIMIIDTHMIVKTCNGYWPGLPLTVLEKLRPNLLFLIETEPEEILSRRTKDKTRTRNQVLTKEIKEELAFSRFVAASCSTLTGAPVIILKNPQGEQLKVAKEILNIIKLLDRE